MGTTIKYLRGAAGIGTTIKYLRGAAGIGLGTTIKYLRRSTSGAAGNGLGTTTKYLRGAAGIGLGATIKYLRRTTSAAAGSGLGTTAKNLVNQNAGAGSKFTEIRYTKAGHEFSESPCSVAAFVVNSEPHTGGQARPSVCVCAGPGFSCSAHIVFTPHLQKKMSRRTVHRRVWRARSAPSGTLRQLVQ
jgi:hypothetical protein